MPSSPSPLWTRRGTEPAEQRPIHRLGRRGSRSLDRLALLGHNLPVNAAVTTEPGPPS